MYEMKHPKDMNYYWALSSCFSYTLKWLYKQLSTLSVWR
jgi:hypothetical protein